MLQLPIVTIPNPAAAISLLPEGAKDIQIRGLILQPRGTNTNPIYIGSAAVSATVYMFRLNAPAGGVPPAPFILESSEGLGNLGQLYAFGTAGEILHVAVILR